MINPYIFPIKGDLSRADVVALSIEAQKSLRGIFEFGIGGSTIILAASSIMPLRAYENAPEWIKRTKNNLELYRDNLLTQPDIIKINYRRPDFNRYLKKEYQAHQPDLIFIDSVPGTRHRTFEVSFKAAVPGTRFMVHDTRLASMKKFLAGFMNKYLDQINFIKPCYLDSNITLLQKGNAHPYEDWNISEKGNHRVDRMSDETGLK